MYTGTRPGFPRHQGGEGVAGTPGACSQVFCHPIRCMFMRSYRQRHVRFSIVSTTTTTTTTVAEGLSSQLVRPLWGLTGETRSRPGVTVAGGHRGLQVQRAGSDDGRHSLGSCCPEDVAVACRPPSGELTHAPADPRALYRTCDEHYYISPGRRPGPQSGFPDGVGGGGKEAAGRAGSSDADRGGR